MNNESSKTITLYLMKPEIKDEKSCLDGEKIKSLISYPLNGHTGIKGTVYVSNTKKTQPNWVRYLNDLTMSKIEIDDNGSNKAVIIGVLKDRYFAITFGFGKSLLNDFSIERNFGVKCVVNTVNETRLRSLSSNTIEDLILSTQKQVNLSTDQNNFNVDSDNEILKSISGIPKQDNIVDFYTGGDSLTFRKKFNINKIGEVIEYFISASYKTDYIKSGFEWIDNINLLKDAAIKEILDKQLVEMIKNDNIDGISFSPSEILDWNTISGFMVEGMRKRNIEDNYQLDLDMHEYFNHLKSNDNIISALKRNKIKKWITSFGNSVSMGSAYKNITVQIEYKNDKYVLNSGEWYKIDNMFYNRVIDYVDNISLNKYSLDPYISGETEGEYNKRISHNHSDDIYCFDTELLSVVGARRRSIEVCDLFTIERCFIHVKRKTQSAQLSHLFSQGKISALSFINDQEFRQSVAKTVNDHFNVTLINSDYEPNTFEVVYAIITKKKGKLSTVLPFFSALNLMTICNELRLMSFKYSVTLIDVI